MADFIAYYRESTDGESGLGIVPGKIHHTTWCFGPLGVCETPANTSTSANAATDKIVFFIRFLSLRHCCKTSRFPSDAGSVRYYQVP